MVLLGKSYICFLDIFALSKVFGIEINPAEVAGIHPLFTNAERSDHRLIIRFTSIADGSSWDKLSNISADFKQKQREAHVYFEVQTSRL